MPSAPASESHAARRPVRSSTYAKLGAGSAAERGIAMGDTNEPLELQGVSHLALVCSDMARTVDFYTMCSACR